MIWGSDGSEIPVNGATVHVQDSDQTTDTPTVVTTDGVSNIGTTSADFTASLESLEGESSADVWFRYRLAGDEPTSDTSTETLSSTGQFTHTASGLQSDSEYDVYAMASVGGTTYSGDILTFTTSA